MSKLRFFGSTHSVWKLKSMNQKKLHIWHFLGKSFERPTHFECMWITVNAWNRSSPPKVFLGKDVRNIYSKFTGEHHFRSIISIKLLRNFIEITLRHGCYPVNVLYIFTTPFHRKTSGGLFLVRHLISKLSIFLIQNHLCIEILCF